MTDGPYRPKISVSSPAVSFSTARMSVRVSSRMRVADGEAYGPRRRARVAFAASFSFLISAAW